jgi:hypothetical protein
MLSFNEVHTDIQQNQQDLIALKTFELNNLKQAVSLMNENNWKDLSFNIQISGDKAELAGITKFDFSNILSEKYITAIKTIIQSGFENEIKAREGKLEQLIELLQ